MSITAQDPARTSARRLPNLISVREAAVRFPFLPEPSIRDLIYHAEERLAANGELTPANGFDICIVRIGSRVLIDFDALLDWIEERRQSHRAPVAKAGKLVTYRARSETV